MSKYDHKKYLKSIEESEIRADKIMESARREAVFFITLIISTALIPVAVFIVFPFIHKIFN